MKSTTSVYMNGTGMNLPDRMKQYERAFAPTLPPRLPIVIRVDGKSFSKYTANLNRPFDAVLMNTMQEVAVQLCRSLQGGVFVYQQSDEISVICQQDNGPQTQPVFGGKPQKIASLAASAATATFNAFANNNGLREASGHAMAMFDARCFCMPWEEVPNYLMWRYRDWLRNSIQMAARARFSHKECQNRNTAELEAMLREAEYPWENLSYVQKNGFFYTTRDINLDGLSKGTAVSHNDFKLALERAREHDQFEAEGDYCGCDDVGSSDDCQTQDRATESTESS